MIKNCVFSYWNNIGEDNFSGFSKFSDYLFSQTLSILQARKFFPKVKMVTNSFGAEVFDKIGLTSLIDDLDISLNEYDNLDKYFWGFTKIHAFEKQKESFIHIDNDFYMWDYPSALKFAEFGFQSPENFSNDTYSYYRTLIDIMNNAQFKPENIISNSTERGLNCGIVSCKSRFDIIEEWKDTAYKYITLNKDHLYKYRPDYLIHLNLLHEQYFISCLLKKNKIQDNKIFFYFYENFSDSLKEGNRFTHLWGTSKRSKETINKVINKVKIENNEIAKLIYKNFQ